jgi:hypothetical protein
MDETQAVTSLQMTYGVRRDIRYEDFGPAIQARVLRWLREVGQLEKLR